MTPSIVARAELCLSLAAARPVPAPTPGQRVTSKANGATGTLVRHYADRDVRRPLRASVAWDHGHTTWCNADTIALLETAEQAAARIQDAACSMLCMWDHVMPGDGRTYGESFVERATR